jgi:lipase maturation factor 1
MPGTTNQPPDRRHSLLGASPPPVFLGRWVFLRLLGCVYLAAFWSLGVQILGLIGQNGILPAGRFLEAVQAEGAAWQAPTFCWINCSDPFLVGLCVAGAAAAVLLIAGVAPVPVLVFLWANYLSLTVAGQTFLGFQWDALLLETGFLAIFFAPGGLWPRLGQETAPSRVVLWLLRLLLFKLMFLSGVVKLWSEDPTWRGLTALHYHYETQPLPMWTSWWMHQTPLWFHKLSVMVTFAVELFLPLLIFAPRLCRVLAFVGIGSLQLLIAATGNYGFFNLLTIALCLPLLDDGMFPPRWRARLYEGRGARGEGRVSSLGSLTRPLRGALAAVVLFVFIMHVMVARPESRALVPRPVLRLYAFLASFESVNTYGLFANMTTRRPEIIIEGSDDGTTWLPYEFKWKPGDVQRRPRFTGLHMPRLDWQMWFAALRGDIREAPWVGNFLIRLLQGAPQVRDLLGHNPFPDRPPRYIRAMLYDYHFTDWPTRRASGAWWRRELMGPFCRPIALEPDR